MALLVIKPCVISFQIVFIFINQQHTCWLGEPEEASPGQGPNLSKELMLWGIQGMALNIYLSQTNI